MTAGRRVVALTERRAKLVRLPRADAAFLLAHPAFDLTPTLEPGVVRVAPRGVVGFLDGPSVRFVVRPKLPWPNLLRLLGSTTPPAYTAAEPASLPADLLAAVARELARRLADTAAAGLVAGYGEADTESPFLRGRLRTADHLRGRAAGVTPSLFPVTEDRFDLDTPWNRVPKAVAGRLADAPDLPPDVRAELRAALVPFESVPARPPDETEFAAAAAEPRAAGYRPLLELCGVVWAALGGGPAGGFLVDLGRAFERHVGGVLTAAIGRRPGWAIELQSPLNLNAAGGRFPLPELRPDVLVRRGRRVRLVLDVKWKRLAPGPAPDDLHQILAYAAVTGAERAALVYPGPRFQWEETPVAGVRLAVATLRVAGPAAACDRADRRLARAAVS